MRCPFLQEIAVRYCQIASLGKWLPQANICERDQRCSGPSYTECPLAMERPGHRPAEPSCPFLGSRETQTCAIAPVRRPLPRNESLFSRCNTDAHRHCHLFVEASPSAASPECGTTRRRSAESAVIEEGGAGDGEIPAPSHLKYAPNHMWIDIGADGSCDVGVDAFLIRALGTVENVWFPAVSGLQKPRVVLAGESASLPLTFPARIDISGANALLRSSPQTMSEDPYGAGWLFEGMAATAAPAPGPEGGDPHWIDGCDAALWMTEESRRMSEFLQTVAAPPSSSGEQYMADGGVFVQGLVSQLDPGHQQELYDRFFRHPGTT